MALPADLQTRVDDAHARSPQAPHASGWQLVRLVGHGQWTEVYQARPSRCTEDWPSDYAVKVLKPQYRDDGLARSLLVREAEVARQVSHRHLASVLAAHVEEPPFYLVMPYLAGKTLYELLVENSAADTARLAVPQALWIARQIAQAVETLHERGWMHGDIKPANILLSTCGHATLIDLGFARPLHAASSRGPRPLCGTLQYAAPELFRSHGQVDQASDIYSLGVTLYEMLTGQRPFQDHDPQDLARAQCEQLPHHPRRLAPQLSPGITRLLSSMLAKEPLRRPAAKELVSQLVHLEIEMFAQR